MTPRNTRNVHFPGLARFGLCVLLLTGQLAFAQGSGRFYAHPTTPSFGAQTSREVALGDLDGDGDLDAVVANGSDRAETVWLNDGTGSFTPHPVRPSVRRRAVT